MWEMKNMKRYNNCIKFGVLFSIVYLIANYYPSTPEFVRGMLDGFGITSIVIGILVGICKLVINKIIESHD